MDIGIDIVAVARMEKILSDATVVRKLFNPGEISDNQESMAGILAAKEAYMKVIGRKLDWLSIEVKKNNLGKPYIADKPNTRVSITHDGAYAVATVLLLD